ncbi:MAG: winged helix-turn-helix domain-containing protein [Deltaproteobacteria bacterium]|nr:winged helix-turn-helix domain-containing protein [Deltaproteobacteria bacterium]MBW2050233.1 winged helix-turn-helix domain-containing protein [Deltaproteobacteria bacterium]MBW2113005.1 winged helix-turn-helix domain-containing protein [Deltaproteobacteria bacterium]MBW2352336.1 winged helix-turn-helix domain-containing protein [Deltaproteobacteria bacterium]
MGRTEEEKKAEKEAMKGLRKRRKQFIKASAARLKEQNRIVKMIVEQMKDGPRTVPEISQAAGIPSADVMWYIATMKKFGQVLEADQDGSYFRYGLAEGESEA